MKILEVEDVLTESPATGVEDWELKIGRFVLISFGYAGGLYHFLEEYIGRKIRITVELVEE